MYEFWKAVFHNKYFQWGGVAFTVLIFIALFTLLPPVIRRLPPDFFSNPKYLDNSVRPSGRNAVLHWLLVATRQIAGVLLVILGTVFLQGVIVVIAGLSIMEFKGKRKLICKLARLGFVWRLFDKIRRRGGCVPLEVPGAASEQLVRSGL